MLATPIPLWYFIIRPLSGARFTEYFEQLMTPLIISIFSVAAAYVAVSPMDADLLRLAVGVVVGALAYGVISYVFNQQLIAAVVTLLPERGASPAAT